jgi:copper homeostasis protein
MKNNSLLEICCGSADDAIEAWHGGADRVELCSSLFLGGLTPTLGTLLEVKEKTDIQVAVMVRPRQGGFCYSETDFAVAIRDAQLFSQHGADALVTGFLREDGRVDLARTKAFVEAADGLPVCFHRAIDLVPDWRVALDVLAEAGVTRVLSSGQAHSAWDGRDTLKQMIEYAADRLVIMAGGGVRAHNIRDLLAYTGATDIHSGCVSETLYDHSNAHNSSLRFGDVQSPAENTYRQVNREKVRALVDKIA